MSQLDVVALYVMWLASTEKLEARRHPHAADARARTNQLGGFVFRILGNALVEVGEALKEKPDVA